MTEDWLLKFVIKALKNTNKRFLFEFEISRSSQRHNIVSVLSCNRRLDHTLLKDDPDSCHQFCENVLKRRK